MYLDQLLLEEVGEWLAKKPFQDNSRKQLASYIQASHLFSERFPLWQLDNEVLENKLRLFGLKPKDLEQEIDRYRKRSRFMQWLFRLFTTINKKIVVWSYYQQCLSFRELQQQKEVFHRNQLDINFELIQPVLKELLAYLLQDIYQFDKFIDRHIGRFNWIEREFLLCFQKHMQKQEIGFFRLLEEKLENLAIQAELSLLLRDTVTEEYKAMKKTIKELWGNTRRYVRQNLYPTQLVPIHLQEEQEAENSEIPPPIEAQPLAGSSNVAQGVDANLAGINGMIEWLEQQRSKKEKLLVQEESVDKEIEIKLFLENSFQHLCEVVELQMEQHQTMVNDVKSSRQNYQEAIKYSEALQDQLIPVFKKCFLLFHPDKCHSENKEIQVIHKELFIQFQNLHKTTVNKIIEGIDLIRSLIPKHDSRLEQQQYERREYLAKQLQEYKDLYRGFEDDHIAVHEEYTEKITALYAKMEERMQLAHAERKAAYAEMRVKMEAERVRIQAEMQAQMQTDMQAYMEVQVEAERVEARKRMEKLDELEKLIRANMTSKQNQDASQDTESAGTSYSSSSKNMS